MQANNSIIGLWHWVTEEMQFTYVRMKHHYKIEYFPARIPSLDVGVLHDSPALLHDGLVVLCGHTH